MPRKPDPGARDRILDIASRLFYERGVRAVGMQQIIDECGCGKNLLYREFSSKDELVVAWLEQARADQQARLAAAIEPLQGDPAAQLVAVVRSDVDALCPGFRGCALRNALVEFPDPDHPAHQVVVAQQEARRAVLRDLAAQAGARDPSGLADRVSLVLDGLSTSGSVLGPDGPAAAAVELAEQLVRDALPAGRTPAGRRGSTRRRAAARRTTAADRAGAEPAGADRTAAADL
jgi:AcrR family transcriptional regulator